MGGGEGNKLRLGPERLNSTGPWPVDGDPREVYKNGALSCIRHNLACKSRARMSNKIKQRRVPRTQYSVVVPGTRRETRVDLRDDWDDSDALVSAHLGAGAGACWCWCCCRTRHARKGHDRPMRGMRRRQT